MRVLRIAVLLFLLILEGTSVRSQSVTQPIEWFGTTANLKASSKVGFLVEGLYRFAGNLQPMQLQFRLGVDYVLSDKLNIMPLAYALTLNPIYGEQPALYVNNEHRIFQQFLYKHKSGRFNFQHRLRTEERFLQKHEIINGEVVDDGFVNQQFRIRYRLNFTVPFKGEKIVPRSWYVQAYDEVFVSFGSTVSPQQPDQNRVFAGVGYQSTSLLSFQGGPFYQVIIKSNGYQRENNIGVMLTLQYNYDMTKKPKD